MNLDGEYVKCVDEAGWGGRWSAVASELAYTRTGPNGPNFVIYNSKEDSYRQVFGVKAQPYQRLWFGTEWSANGERLFFKASRKDGSPELSSILLSQPEKVRVLFLRNTYANIGLLSDDEFIVPYGSKEFGVIQLHLVKVIGDQPTSKESGVHIEGQFTTRNSYGCAISADRKKIYYVSVPKAP